MDQPAPPRFNPNAPHQAKPKIRPVRGFPVQHGEQVLLGLADARQISDRVVYTIPQVQMILPHLNGQNDLDAVAAAVGRGLRREDLEMLIAQLDDAGLLEGPNFEVMLKKVREQFDSSDVLPPSGTADFADALVAQEIGEGVTDEQKAELGPARLRKVMDEWMTKALEQVEDPSFNALPKAIVAPHLDYQRGWMNYAHAYGRMRVVDRPDRVVILGTNHFGHGTGVVGCDKGYQSPLGTCASDKAFIAALGKHLSAEQSRQLFEHRYDHEREHSIELHIPWIQHVFGDAATGTFPKVFAALVHDPSVNNGEAYDGNGLGIMPFIDAVKKAIAESPGRTLIVSSADLAHIGASFGDRVQFTAETEEAQQFRNKVLQHDSEMVTLVRQGKAEELVSSMAWMQNPTRWCSVGNLVATMKITGASEVRVLNYTIAGDQQGVALVSSMAGVIA
jgi:MEMO1 family protein